MAYNSYTVTMPLLHLSARSSEEAAFKAKLFLMRAIMNDEAPLVIEGKLDGESAGDRGRSFTYAGVEASWGPWV